MAAVLMISSHSPDQATKGCAARLAAMIEHLFARGLEIDFLHIARRRERIATLPIARRCLRSVRHISLKNRPLNATIPKPIRAAARPSSSIVLRELHRWSRTLHHIAPLEQDIAEAIDRSDPDLVWIDHAQLAAVLPSVDAQPDRSWIVDTHDVMHLRDESRRRAGLTVDFDISRAEEIRLLQRFQLVIAIQDAEQAVFEEMLPGRRVITVGHALQARPLPARRPTICFVGSKIDVNVQGITRFIEQSWPAIAANCPEARLEVVGTVCRAVQVEQLATHGGGRIVLRGLLPSTHDIYDGPSVMICPLWAGSGLKIKMVEALSYGKATVTTPIGAQGLEPGAGKAFLVAESPRDFVEPVLRLLSDSRERNRVEAAATIFARRQFSEQRVWRELDASLDQLLRRPTLSRATLAPPRRSAA